MASYYSEKEAVTEYKRSIQENRNELETYFKKYRPWKYLKVKNCLTSEELDTLQRDRSTSIPLLLDTILVKNDVHTFTSFSKAVYSMPHSLGGEIFPFASSVGGLPVTEPQTRETGEILCSKCIISFPMKYMYM